MRIKLIILICILCIVIAGCKSKDQVEEENIIGSAEQTENLTEAVDSESDEVTESEVEDNPVEEVDSNETKEANFWTEKYGFELGNDYIIHGETDLYEHADRFVIGPVLHTTKPGQKYIFEEMDGPLVKVKSPDRSGWVSIWYFTDEAKNIVQEEDPYEMIVFKPTTFSYYPNEEEPYGFELTTGKVVQVVKRYQDWVSVRATRYAAEFPGDIWVKGENLIEYDPNFATEGVLKLGGKVYTEGGRVKEESSGFPLMIVGEIEDMYAMNASGGRIGYIKKEDFVPNPFVEPVLSMRFAVNLGMDADYLVEELTGQSVTHRYFDYQHSFEPEEETNTVTFEEMLESEDGIRLYTLHLFLSYPTTEVELKPMPEMIEKIETDADFRKQLGQLLGKPLYSVPHELKLTSEIIKQNQ
jgi:hypothetical protein